MRDLSHGRAAILALAAGLAYALYVVVMKAAVARAAPLPLAAWTFTTAAVVMAPALLESGTVRQIELGWPWLLYLGGVTTAGAYALYTMSPETVAKFHTHLLPATLPFVLYGIFRYLYLLYRRQLGGNPSELFLHDRALFVNTLCWIAAVLLIIYGIPLR